jgi:B12-binding domain/radical SAM domain protein of rhizo-twelve system
MRYALVNPLWSFEGSTYFGSQQPVLPIELFSAQDFLRRAGHEVLLIDAFLERLSPADITPRLDAFDEDFLVMPTTNSYLFWRCPQPELRIPRQWLRALGRRSTSVLIGPHGSATPRAALVKTGADIVLRGEPDQTLAMLASQPRVSIPGCVWMEDGRIAAAPEPLGVTDMRAVGPADYSNYPLELHTHKHHVFSEVAGLGAEVEFARGCPYACTFCNKTLFRNKYRERELTAVLAEIDALIARGVTYIYFIDEIFGVGQQVRKLLEAIAARPIAIGFQSRIDLWDEASLDLLGRAHCISFECGIESITEEGRNAMNKKCRIPNHRIAELLIYARQRIPWVQANLIKTAHDDSEAVAAFQTRLKARGVWVSEPVPMFPFPGSPEYVETFGRQPDDRAWERAHEFYVGRFAGKGFSDIQARQPASLQELECAC